MKFTHLMLKTLGFITMLLAMISCGGDDSEKQEVIPEKNFIKIDVSELSVENTSSSQQIQFSTSKPWTAKISAGTESWCSISPNQGNAGNASMNVKVLENTTYEERNTTITLTSANITKKILVTQKQKDALIIESNKIEVSDEGGDISFNVKANIDVTCEIKSGSDWIHQKNNSRGMSAHKFTFTVDKNEDKSSRQAEILVKGGNFSEIVTVYQKGEQPRTVISQHEYTVASEGATIKIEVKSNSDYTYQLPKVDWITESKSRAMSAYTHYIDVKPNSGYESRSSIITFTNTITEKTDTVTILQMQKDALVVAKPTYEIADKGGKLDIEVGHNVDFTTDINVDWITLQSGRTFVNEKLTFQVAQNTNTAERSGKITFISKDKKITQEVKVTQDAKVDERKILIDFYNATGGPQWTKNTNWCSDKPLNEWHGVHLNYDGTVYALNLFGNNLTGSIPESIGRLSSLQHLQLVYNHLTGNIPSSISKLKQLKSLYLGFNHLTGQIPKEILELPKLDALDLSVNQFSGEIPSGFGNKNLRHLELCYNNFTGKVPTDLINSPSWQKWTQIITGNELDLTGVTLPAPKFNVTTLNGKTISDAIYSQHKLTILFQFSGGCPISRNFTNTMLRIYEKCRPLGLEIIGVSVDNKEETEQYMSEAHIPWDAFCYKDNYDKFDFGMTRSTPELHIMDSEANIVFTTTIDKKDELEEFVYKKLGVKIYESTDFSADGQVVTLQKATEGNGIDIVLMGDGYSDRQIAAKEYDADMKFMCDKIFTVEPYKSFRQLFNVYYVTVVSPTEGVFENKKTAFDIYFGDATFIGGNDKKCMDYARKIIDESRMNEAAIVVAVNSSKYSGTCWMYSSAKDTDYGSGCSVSYFTKTDALEKFEQVLHHELCGHGFAKLGDEYSVNPGYLPQDKIEHYHLLEPRGWWKNIDFTDNPAKIKWASYLTNPLYESEVGIFEGGGTFAKGVWHPSEDNIMVHNTGGFNAPSREAIYYRIHKLAYGPEWKYKFDDFVIYDAINRNQKSRVSKGKRMKPLHAPIVLNKTWREACSSEKVQ